jgi:hypothetical protein
MATSIYCPKCEWAPGPHDRWMCHPGCLTVWNTFETRARCPGCQKQWQVTACLRCHAFSPHEDGYHDRDEVPEHADDAFDREEELVGVGAAARPPGESAFS